MANAHPANHYLLGDEGYLGKDLAFKLKQMGYKIWTPYRKNMQGAKEHNDHQCNDFNGPANSSHYYWSRRSGNIAAAKALKNFVGSDCDWHQIEYGCEMNRNLKCRGLSKHPKNCSSFSSKWHHTNWSVRLHWRS